VILNSSTLFPSSLLFSPFRNNPFFIFHNIFCLQPEHFHFKHKIMTLVVKREIKGTKVGGGRMELRKGGKESKQNLYLKKVCDTIPTFCKSGFKNGTMNSNSYKRQQQR
jgi:hypothetical protein